MFKNYLKTVWRNLLTNKTYSFINIAGLAAGMAVTLLIGLSIWDEWQFDTSHTNYDRIAQVMQNQTNNGETSTGPGNPIPLAGELRRVYGSDFKHVVLSSWSMNSLMAAGDKKLNTQGNFMEAEAPDMLSLHMLRGSGKGLDDKRSILISGSMARALFGELDPVGRTVSLNVDLPLTVTGVYQDFPLNSSFHEVNFIAPFFDLTSWTDGQENNWNNNSFQVFVQVAGQKDMAEVSDKIRNILRNKTGSDGAKARLALFLHPMRRWHLYGEFRNGINTGGNIQYVRKVLGASVFQLWQLLSREFVALVIISLL